MKEIFTERIIEENARREALLEREYDPESGRGCTGTRVRIRMMNNRYAWVPVAMKRREKGLWKLRQREFELLRMRYDFEYWCWKCVTVKDKSGAMDIRLRLNRPQRLVLERLERQRESGCPIRAIMLKARQMGGSTLVQTYMAWIQLLHCDNWNSLICAHVKDGARTIRAMMTKLLREYPKEYLPEGLKPQRLVSFEGSQTTMRLGSRKNTVTIGSAETPESVRGKDIAMAHLSEVAFWRSSTQHDPNDIIRSVSGSIALSANTLLVVESTANGVGNFFHQEWLRASAGDSDKVAIFVPWYESEIYRLEVKDAQSLWQSMDDYETWLWELGLSLSQIAWYHAKRREYSTDRAMKSEYPTTAEEAFSATDRCVFPMEAVVRLRADCCRAEMVGDVVAESPKGRGAMRGVRFVADAGGRLKVWHRPGAGVGRYLVVVDIGGRSATSDYSVIAVLDREGPGGRPCLAAQWRGHTDHDLLAWKAVTIACHYGRALLVIESNTLETERTEGENSAFILEEIADAYNNMYYRNTVDALTGNRVSHPGFHTNAQTKPLIVNNLIAEVRDGGYTERDGECANELLSYERKPNGSYGSKNGSHDDILMTRAIGLYVVRETGRHGVTDTAALKSPW